MAQEPLFETLTKGDNPLLAEVVNVVKGVGGGSDLSQLLDVLVKGEQAFGRFVPLLERASNTILKLQEAHANRGMYPADPDPEPVGDLNPARVVAPAPPPAIPPIRVYQKLLGVLSHLPAEMTIGQALADAREKKDMLLQLISHEMAVLSAPGGDDDKPGE